MRWPRQTYGLPLDHRGKSRWTVATRLSHPTQFTMDSGRTRGAASIAPGLRRAGATRPEDAGACHDRHGWCGSGRPDRARAKQTHRFAVRSDTAASSAIGASGASCSRCAQLDHRSSTARCAGRRSAAMTDQPRTLGDMFAYHRDRLNTHRAVAARHRLAFGLIRARFNEKCQECRSEPRRRTPTRSPVRAG
jgi:hypothetical protein